MYSSLQSSWRYQAFLVVFVSQYYQLTKQTPSLKSGRDHFAIIHTDCGMNSVGHVVSGLYWSFVSRVTIRRMNASVSVFF